MMNTKTYLLFVSLVLICFSSFAQGITLEETRKLYTDATTTSAGCEKLYNKLSSVSETDNSVLRGYKGAVTLMMANYKKTTGDKIKFYNQGKKTLEKAIADNNKDVELRFLRFTIQTNLPPSLKYNKDVTSDKDFIVNNINTVKDTEVKKKIIDYMSDAEETTDEDVEKLSK